MEHKVAQVDHKVRVVDPEGARVEQGDHKVEPKWINVDGHALFPAAHFKLAYITVHPNEEHQWGKLTLELATKTIEVECAKPRAALNEIYRQLGL